jgi:energy-coupling factor transporter ATP-binding protein EcfA2
MDELTIVFPASQRAGIDATAVFSKVSRLNVLAGTNGAGKSTLLKRLDATFEEFNKQPNTDFHFFSSLPIALATDLEFFSGARNRVAEKQLQREGIPSFAKIAKALVSTNDMLRAVDYLEYQSQQLKEKVIDGVLLLEILKDSIPEKERSRIGSGWWNVFLEEMSGILNLDRRDIKRCIYIPEFRTCRPVPLKAKDGLFGDIFSSESRHKETFNLTEHLFVLKSASRGSDQWKRYQRLRTSFKKVTEGVDFEVINDDSYVLIEFSFHTSSWFPAHKTGKGFEDVLVMLFWLTEPTINVVLIDELEAHLHPRLLLRLADFISNNPEQKICFTTTHSPDLLRSSTQKSVYWISCDSFSKEQPLIKISNQTSETSMLRELGIQPLEYFGASVLVLVEGPSDEIVIREFLRQMNFPILHDLLFLHLGGDNMTHFDLKLWKERFKVIALIDSDPKSATVRERFVQQCEENNVDCFRLERYGIENYFSIEAIAEVFPDLRDLASELPINVKISDYLGVSLKRNVENLARKTSVAGISGTVLHKFLLEVIELIKPVNTILDTKSVTSA